MNFRYLFVTVLFSLLASFATAQGALTFKGPQQIVQPGTIVNFPITADNLTDVLGIQGSIEWDATAFSYVGVVRPAPLSMAANDFGAPGAGIVPTNKITFTWFEPSFSPVSVGGDIPLFFVRLNVTGLLGTTGVIRPVNTPTDLGYVDENFTFFAAQAQAGSVIIGGSLPVEWIDFSGIARENGSIELNWGTAYEVNNDRFEIERSADGLVFERIGNLAGAGSTDQKQTYSFVDDQVLNAKNFYRIRQIDFNGNFSFSNIIEVSALRSSRLMTGARAGQEQLRVRFSEQVRGTVSISLVDISGKLAWNGTVETGSLVQDHILSPGSLTPGVYFLKARTLQGETAVEQVMIR